MQPRRIPIGVLLIIPVVIGLGVYAFTGQQPVEPAPGSETSTATTPPFETATASATPDIAATETAGIWATATYETQFFPTPVPQVMTHGVFHDRALVRVRTGDGDCLNARWSPALSLETSGVNACLPEGHLGMIIGPAYEAEGHWWWYMAGAGYVAETYLEYAGEADLRQPMAPQYASAGGHIAFMREDGAIYVMRPDGADQRQLVAPLTVDGYTVWPSDYAFSPDGTMLSYNITIWRDTQATSELHVVSLAGYEVASFVDVAGRFWSPDGSRIAVVSTVAPDGVGNGWQPVPGYADLEAGAVTLLPRVVDQPHAWMNDLPSFNYDGTLLMASYGWYNDDTTSGAGIVVTDLSGGEVLRLDSGPQLFLSMAAWSPTENLIAMQRSAGDGTGEYAVYDLAARSFVAAVPIPAWSPARGGGCGAGGDMARVSWSRDGLRIHFGWMFGEAGTNGIWTLDVATGATRLLPVANSTNAPAGPGTLVVLADFNHIFVGDTADGSVSLITDGRSPVWSSGQ